MRGKLFFVLQRDFKDLFCQDFKDLFCQAVMGGAILSKLSENCTCPQLLGSGLLAQQR